MSQSTATKASSFTSKHYVALTKQNDTLEVTYVGPAFGDTSSEAPLSIWVDFQGTVQSGATVSPSDFRYFTAAGALHNYMAACASGIKVDDTLLTRYHFSVRSDLLKTSVAQHGAAQQQVGCAGRGGYNSVS